MHINETLLELYAFWSGVLILKVLFIVLVIGKHRHTKKIFMNPDDYAILRLKGKPQMDDPDIERVRRAHLNDLENVIPWLIITYIWLWTNPSVAIARLLIQTFAIARIIHTFFYVIFPMQPFRVISFSIGYSIIGYEAFSIVCHFL